MPLEKGYKQVLDVSDTSVDFDVSGESLLLLTSHQGGTWSLGIVAPDGELVDTGFAGTAAFQQRLVVPDETIIRLHGGMAGAKAWVGRITRDAAGSLL